MSRETYDLVVIGGGVNGCGVARDAAGRGLSVLLVEKGDLACGTSSASTKLIHGGLRYLEHYEFRLVRAALGEREVLLTAAPHIIRPMKFILPHHSALRPSWLIRLGLFIYDHLGGRKHLPASRMINLRKDEGGAPLKDEFVKAFEYSDCWVDDARLVALNAIDAAARGAQIRTACEMVAAAHDEAGEWKITLCDADTGQQEEVKARALVNAAGPWVAEVAQHSAFEPMTSKVRLVKGSHIIVPKMFAHDRAYILQNQDRRIVFAIPYEHDFTLIGTTDIDVPEGPGKPEASEAEIDYLCRAVNEYFTTAVRPSDVVWSYAGIRPLYNDGGESAQEITRDYVLDLQDEANAPPALNIYGGKITTYRELSEDVMAKLQPFFPQMGPNWTHDASLPGGDFEIADFDNLVERLLGDHPVLSSSHARRLCRAYGTRAAQIVAGVQKLDELGHYFGADLYQCEVEYLIEHEWARSAEDILWRRSKLGLRLSDAEKSDLANWLQDRDQHAKLARNG